MLEIRRVEKITKGMANHNRIKILVYLENHSGSTLYDIAQEVKTDFKNVSQHTRRLVESGLIIKKYKGQYVSHDLTSRGRQALKFFRMVK